MANNLVQSKSNSKLKTLDPYQTNLLYNHINRLNLFQTIDQSLVFNSPSSASSLPQSKLLAESSSSLDEDYEGNNSDSDDNSNHEQDDDDDYVESNNRRLKGRHNHHHHHHHHHSADESDLCDQEIINIFNIDDRNCLVSINNNHRYFTKPKTPTRRPINRNMPAPAPTNSTMTTNSYLMRPSLDFEKMIKVIIKDLSSV